MLQKGVVPLLIKCARSQNDEISALAMSGLSAISRAKDCRQVMLQQPNDEGLKMMKEALTSKNATKASAAMLLTHHLVWDEEWCDALKDVVPKPSQH